MHVIKALCLSAIVVTGLTMPAIAQQKSSTDSKTVDRTASTITDVTVKKAMRIMDKPGMVILDVRTPEETAEGMIPGAKEVDYLAPDFKDKVQQLDKSKSYLVYCRSGKRSAAACKIMSKQGFNTLYNLEGGYLAWQEVHPAKK